jgi:hypothetical protein
MRLVARPFMAARKARNQAEELITEVEELVTRNEAQVGAKAIEELAGHLAATVKAIGARDATAVAAASKELTAAFSDAQKRAALPGGPPAARYLGDSKYEAKTDARSDWYIGDVHSDGKPELGVLSAAQGQIYHYTGGAKTPTVSELEYPGDIGLLHTNDEVTVTPFPTDDEDPAELVVKGDFIELELPEKSGVYLVFTKGVWQTVWMSD